MSGGNPHSINGSKSTIYPELTFSGNSKSKLFKVVSALAIFFFITTVIFVIVFAYYYTKYNDQDSPALCSTPNCVISAATMAKKMNFSVNPCEDFSEYACGRFISESFFPDGRTRVATFIVLNDENKLIMKDIITANKTEEYDYLSNMKRLYRSCTDEAGIEKLGLTPYLRDTTFVNDWPTLNQNWTEVDFDLNDVIVRYEMVYIEPFFLCLVSNDLMNSSKKALYLAAPTLGLSQEYFGRPRNDAVILAYQKYLADTAMELGAKQTVAEQDASDVVDLEIKLSKIMVPKEEQSDFSKQYNPIKLSELIDLYPEIHILKAITARFQTAHINLSDSEIIINLFPTYIANISKAINGTTKRTLQNLFGFKYAISKVESLTRRMREIKLEFEKKNSGTSAESPRAETCLDIASKVFLKGMSKQFVNRTFTESARQYMEEMIDNLEEEFRKMIAENTWMGQETKTEVYQKLSTIKRTIGYPGANFTDVDIERKYENYKMQEDNFYENRVLYNNLRTIEKLQSLRKPVDKNEGLTALYEVNAHYSVTQNEIVLPAGILQSPFFSQTFQDKGEGRQSREVQQFELDSSVNYGAIGAVIGHEITHGFDNDGSQYDAYGNLRNWWQKLDHDNFLQRMQCIVDQNSNFYVKDINMTLNGINLQGESVADIGGVKDSYRAYKELVRRKGELPTLPGLGLTHDQLFFLGYSQLWCEKMTKETLIGQVTLDHHPPGKYRIIGPLQNSAEFAKAFNCPTGSYMNPTNKCSVW